MSKMIIDKLFNFIGLLMTALSLGFLVYLVGYNTGRNEGFEAGFKYHNEITTIENTQACPYFKPGNKP